MTSFTPIYDRTKVMAGQVALRLAPYNATSPAVLPADTVVLGGTWPAAPQPWDTVGASEQGASLVFRRGTQSLTIEEQLTPVKVESSEVEMRVEITLAEDTLKTMRLAMGGGTITTQAAGVGLVGKQTLQLSNDLEHYALGLEGKNPEGYWRRILIPDVVSIADVEVANRRAASLRLYKVSLWCLSSIEQVVITNMTAPATS